MYKSIPDDRRRAQLSALRADDSEIQEIVSTAAHVAVYELQELRGAPEWRKTDVEGSLYLAKRRNGQLQIIVKNQSDAGDFSQIVDGKVSFEIKENTFFYRVGNNGRVRGIWFQEGESLQIFARFIQESAMVGLPTSDPSKALMQLLGKSPEKSPAPPSNELLEALSRPLSKQQSHRSASDSARPEVKQLSGFVKPSDSVGGLLAAAMARDGPFTSRRRDTVTISRSDLRLVLADLVGSDEFIDRVFDRLSSRMPQ